MNKLRNSWILIIAVFFITAFNTDMNIIRLEAVQGTIEPTNESEIVIGIDFSHENDINSSDLINLTNIIDTTFSSLKVVRVEDEFSSSSLFGIDVLSIIAPNVEYSESEIDAVEEFIRKGNSLLISTGYRNQTLEPTNSLIYRFGLNFSLESAIIPEYVLENQSINYDILARNFTTPSTPITENISQLILPNGVGISFNESYLESYQSPSITFYNPILVLNLDEEPSENNTLASTLEFENGARVLAVGSAEMFNNSYIEPLSNTSNIFLDNTNFILNGIRWLGRNTGIMNLYDSVVDKIQDQTIQIGEIIKGNVTLIDSQYKAIPQGQVIITLERTGSILSQRTMQLDPDNSSNYLGWVSTEGLSYGFCDVVFMANRRGYLPVELSAGRLYLERAFPSPELPNLALFGLFFATVIIFLSTALFIRTSLKKYE
ncbi:MAG: hypothetical protein ACXACU_07525 [Candidatus Hodarchaeales archaeon]